MFEVAYTETGGWVCVGTNSYMSFLRRRILPVMFSVIIISEGRKSWLELGFIILYCLSERYHFVMLKLHYQVLRV